MTLTPRRPASPVTAVEAGRGDLPSAGTDSIYRQALGTDFERLHPMVRRRFGLCSGGGVGCIGEGVMEEIWGGPAYTLPFLYLGVKRRILFPERGRDVPFTIRNYAYVDGLGRETVTWLRTFHLPGKTRRFDAYMVNGAERGCVVDYLGTHQHLAVDIELGVDERGGIRLRSGPQRFYEGPVGFALPMLLSGTAEVCEWWDEREERFRITVDVRNRVAGRLFGYRGWFRARWVPVPPGRLPADALPKREEARE
jgi:hypothetical protein